ncbi:MAG: hypothetical protein AAB358_03975 [Patescibacteria group bacterium]
MPEKQSITQEQKIWGAVSYIWFLSIVALAARKEDDFIRWHANQGLLLFIISLILMLIPPFGWFINILVVIAVIVGIIKALTGEKWELPILSGTAQKLGDWLVKMIKL